MPRRFLVLMLAAFALAACQSSADVDRNEVDRQDRQLFRELGGD